MKKIIRLICLIASAPAAFQAAAAAGNPEYTFTAYAGPDECGPGAIDAVGSAARFSYPSGIILDPAGNLYVTDHWNQTVRKVTPNGEVRTLAGLAGEWGSADGSASARFCNPDGIARDSSGNLFVADSSNGTIRKIDPSGTVTTFAGTAGSFGSVDGTGSAARFHSPSGLAIDSGGNLYVTEGWAHTIRKITPEAVVTTFAGKENARGKADGSGGAARFNNPMGIVVGRSGNIYVADSDNHTIRKISPKRAVTTLAGMAGAAGIANGQGSTARFRRPDGIAVDSSNNLYVADSGNQLIRRVTPAGMVSTVVGKARSRGGTDGIAGAARFNYPKGLAVSPNGELFVADWGNSSLRKISTNGAVATIAGKSEEFGSDDGAALVARFQGPSAVAIDGTGNVYVADTGNHTVRKISPDRIVSTLAGAAGKRGSANGTGPNARFNSPQGLAVNSAGWVYVADTSNHVVRVINPTGVVRTLAGVPGQAGSANGRGSTARFKAPQGIAVDVSNFVYVADTGNATIRKITPNGTVSTLAGAAGKMDHLDDFGTAARFRRPIGLAVDAERNVYVADYFVSSIRRITPSGDVTSYRSWVSSSFDYFGASGVALDAAGNVYACGGILDSMLVFSPKKGDWTAFTGAMVGNTAGTGLAARFDFPQGMAVDAVGRLFIADSGSHVIRLGVTNTCEDRPVLDSSGPIGAARQLDTQPQDAVAWAWSFTQQPLDSHSEFNDPAARNPVFVPEKPGLYQISFKATNQFGMVCLRSLTYTATNALWLSGASRSNNAFSVSIPTDVGKTYVLEYKDSPAAEWGPAASAVGTGSKVVLQDANATPNHRIYRVRQE